MSREPRQRAESQIYHVIIKGVNAQLIFERDVDFSKMRDILLDCKNLSAFKLYAYCLMNNHAHFLIKEVHEDISLIMKRIGTRYASWFNWRYGRQGQLFQNRFYSEAVRSDEQLITTIRYIHDNPVKAGIVVNPEDYYHSSCLDYCVLTDLKESLVDVNDIVEIFGKKELLNSLNESSSEGQFLEIRQRHLTDEEVLERVLELSSSVSLQCFLHQSKVDKALCFRKLKEEGISLRQISRVTGETYYSIRKA